MEKFRELLYKLVLCSKVCILGKDHEVAIDHNPMVSAWITVPRNPWVFLGTARTGALLRSTWPTMTVPFDPGVSRGTGGLLRSAWSTTVIEDADFGYGSRMMISFLTFFCCFFLPSLRYWATFRFSCEDSMIYFERVLGDFQPLPFWIIPVLAPATCNSVAMLLRKLWWV